MVLKQFLFLAVTFCFSTNLLAHEYIVKKGDTLNEISKRFNISVGELIELNSLKGGRLFIGSIILIPDSITELDYELIDNSGSVEDTGAKNDTSSDTGEESDIKIADINTVNNLTTDKLQIGPTLFFSLLSFPIGKAEDPKNDSTISDGIYEHHLSQPPAPEPLPPLRYSVKKGDTLSEISTNFGVTVQDIMQTNGLSDSRLKTGMILVIPSTGTNGVVRNITNEKPSIKYIVKDGDTIEELSEMFDIPIDSIKQANYFTDNIVTEGEILILPDAKYEKEPLLQASIVASFTDDQDLAIPTESTTQSIDDKVVYHEEEDATDIDLNSLARRVINTALMFLGVPYKFGGNSPSTGLDCSAYVRKVFGILNIELPRTARDIYNVGSSVQKSQLATGDLVFFRTYARYPSHVGIYLWDNKFIHASSRSKMVTIDDLDFNYYKKRYIGAKRIESSGLFYDEMSRNQTVFKLN